MNRKDTKEGRTDTGQRDEGFLADALAHSFDGIIVADRAGTIKFASPSALRLFGHNLDNAPTILEWVRRMIPDSRLREQVMGFWKQDAESSHPPERLFPVTPANGDERWCRFQMACMKSGDLVINVQDVTDHRLIEERSRALFEQAAETVLLIDPETGALLDFNNIACESLGYTRDELRKLKITDIAVNPDAATTKRHMQNILTTGSDTFEARRRTKSGDLIDMRVSVRVISIRGKRLLQSVAHDITAEKRAMQALKESEEKFRNLAEQSPNMIFINKGGQVVYANTKCEEIMGYSRKELCSPHFNFMKLVAPEYHAATGAYFEKHMKGLAVPSYEYMVVTKDGSRIPAVISTKLIRYDGQPAILGIVTDISQLKHAEASLRESAANLLEQKNAVEVKNAALKEILTQIETEKLEIKQHVTASAENLVMPILHKLKRKANPKDRRHLTVLESSVRDLTSKFGAQISGGVASLSAREMEICNMIRTGLTSKEIAESLQVSVRTVDTYRNRIRKKLGISNTNVNLYVHIQTLT